MNDTEQTQSLLSALFSLQFGSLLLWAAASLIAGIVIGHMARQAYEATPDKSKLSMRWALRLLPLAAPSATIVLLTVGLAIFRARDLDMHFGTILTHAALGWFLLTAIHVMTQSRAKTIFAAMILIPYMTLVSFGMMDDVSDRLSDVSFQLGKFDITALHIMRFAISVVLLVWLTGALTRGVDYSLGRVNNIHGNTRQLFLTIARTGIYIAAFLFALSMLGIDLTAFAVFSGALGVGLGFGLQKIASNFVSGLILLTERAINIGDMIELGEVRGIVRYTSARYTLVEIGDSREVMIPNESFIAQPVINWTLSNTHGLLRMNVPVSYDSDLDRAREIMIQSALDHPRCLPEPAPTCNLQTYGDIGVNFQLVVWIGDIRENRSVTQSEILMEIWRRFRENGIGIPHQIRDTQISTTLTDREG